jgi:hypothetical protein
MAGPNTGSGDLDRAKHAWQIGAGELQGWREVLACRRRVRGRDDPTMVMIQIVLRGAPRQQPSHS